MLFHLSFGFEHSQHSQSLDSVSLLDEGLYMGRGEIPQRRPQVETEGGSTSRRFRRLLDEVAPIVHESVGVSIEQLHRQVQVGG